MFTIVDANEDQPILYIVSATFYPTKKMNRHIFIVSEKKNDKQL
jgi:hypothetical protein